MTDLKEKGLEIFIAIHNGQKEEINAEEYDALQALLEPALSIISEYEKMLGEAKKNRHVGEVFEFRGARYKVLACGSAVSYKGAFELALSLLEADDVSAVKDTVETQFTTQKTKLQKL